MLKGRPRLLRWSWYLLFVLTVFAFVIGVLALLYLVFPPAPQTILLLGIDADGESASAQADAVILVNISPASFLVNVVSLPSDIWLTTSGGQLQQLRELYRPLETTPQDKAAAIRDVLERNLGVSINHVVIVDMADVAALVDAIGGVKLDVERALIDDAFPVDEETVKRVRFDAGLQQMNGERAVTFSRIYHPDDTTMRAMRHIQLLLAAGEQLAHPSAWINVLGIWNQIETDLTIGDLLALAPPFIFSQGGFGFYTLKDDLRDYIDDQRAVLDTQPLVQWLNAHFASP